MQSREVINSVPTPKPSIGAPEPTSSAMRYSSRSLETTIFTLERPCWSRIARACLASAPRSPLSIRIA